MRCGRLKKILQHSRRNPNKLPQRKDKAEQALKEDQEAIAALTRKLAAAPESQKDNLQDQIDVAKAQMDLDQDEVDDAAEDLEQAGGDPQAKIKRLKAEHDASDQAPKAAAGSNVNPYEQDYQARTFLNVFRAWNALREKKAQLEAARDEAMAKQQRLAVRHTTLQAQGRQGEREPGGGQAAGEGICQGQRRGEPRRLQGGGNGSARFSEAVHARSEESGGPREAAAGSSSRSATFIPTGLFWSRIANEPPCTDMIESVLWILLVLVAVYVANRLIEQLFTGMKAENKRIDTLRAVAKFAAQALGVILIAFLIFGMPNQTTTVLGLAGAGLTVAMKDFIVGFFGWFVLMGRNGLRVGDWVEINGVTGEVIEVGLLKTVLLETGNWTDAGHPTGRRVSFVNTFAIEGHFFNFTTSGQWMWDELELAIPNDQDPYAIIDALQKVVEKETEENARKAEAEWSHSTTRYRVQSLSAKPSINVRPTGSSIEVSVRYITRAYERHETRKRLYAEVLELLRGKRVPVKA